MLSLKMLRDPCFYPKRLGSGRGLKNHFSGQEVVQNKTATIEETMLCSLTGWGNRGRGGGAVGG